MSRLVFLVLLLGMFAIGLAVGLFVASRQPGEEQSLIFELSSKQAQIASLKEQRDEALEQLKNAPTQDTSAENNLRNQIEVLKAEKADLAEKVAELETQRAAQAEKPEATLINGLNAELAALKSRLDGIQYELEKANEKVMDLETKLMAAKQEIQTLRNAPPIKLVIGR